LNGRFAPSPTGTLHLGNLRTALLAWLFARSAASRFIVRMEDLDPGRVRPGAAEEQLADLAAIGVDWDGEVVYQSARLDRYAEAIAVLRGEGRVYECFCTRAEIRAAASAPHGPLPEGAYPGTCLRLSAAELAEKRASGRPPALRVRADAAHVRFQDRLHGPQEGVVDDFVVQRNDGAPAYNLAVVVDDAAPAVPRPGARRAGAAARPRAARPGARRRPAGQAPRRRDAARGAARPGPGVDGPDAGQRPRSGDLRPHPDRPCTDHVGV
jgi:glutamyl-tRNA synthetase